VTICKTSGQQGFLSVFELREELWVLADFPRDEVCFDLGALLHSPNL
jgi:hypothetical protein